MKRELRLAGTAFGCLIAAACGGQGAKAHASTGDASGPDASIPGSNSSAASGDNVDTSGSFSSGISAGSAGSSGSTSGSSGAATSGTSASGANTSGTVETIEAGPPIGGEGGVAHPSAGCGKPWLGMTGQWVSQPTGCDQGDDNQGTAACQTIPPGGVVPDKATKGSPEHRGWWVYVPNGYDPTKPYRVIYEGAGCGDGNWFDVGKDGYPYENADGGNAILVGLDYDTYSDVPGCYDNLDPQSNDFTFFPWLQTQIESELCIDTGAEFFSGYSSGAWVGQQLDCAFPDKLRGVVSVTGCEPGAPGYPGAQYSPCVDKPTAAFYVKDFGDTDTTYACIIPACTRMLKQNGCSVTKCDPLDNTTTTPYAIPPGVTPPVNTRCVQFNGCPADYPVVFCVTYNQTKTDDQNWGVVPLFWDFMVSLSPR
jgi:hypothetical protein